MSLHSFRGARHRAAAVDRRPLGRPMGPGAVLPSMAGSGSDLARDWREIPTTSRRDLAERPWDFVPDDEPLDRLIIYRTAGTTGHPIVGAASSAGHPLLRAADRVRPGTARRRTALRRRTRSPVSWSAPRFALTPTPPCSTTGRAPASPRSTSAQPNGRAKGVHSVTLPRCSRNS